MNPLRWLRWWRRRRAARKSKPKKDSRWKRFRTAAFNLFFFCLIAKNIETDEVISPVSMPSISATDLAMDWLFDETRMRVLSQVVDTKKKKKASKEDLTARSSFHLWLDRLFEPPNDEAKPSLSPSESSFGLPWLFRLEEKLSNPKAASSDTSIGLNWLFSSCAGDDIPVVSTNAAEGVKRRSIKPSDIVVVERYEASSLMERDRAYQRFLEEAENNRLGLESFEFDTIEEMLIECVPGSIPQHLDALGSNG